MTDPVPTPFIFPSDRFPSSEPQPVPPLPSEEFGPALSFNPQSEEYLTGIPHEEIHHPGFQFIPTETDIRTKKMFVSYNCVTNKYFRPQPPHDLKPVGVSDWETCLWRFYNIERKEEGDWQMTYLARIDVPTGNSGNIFKAFAEYRFNLKPVGLKVKNLSMRLPFKTYRDGKVRVWVCSHDDYTLILDPQELKPVVRAKGWDDFIIRVELSGQELDGVAYQYAQLYRQHLYQQPINADWKDPFRVVIEME